ncbi:S66 peptidase family protein [Oxynema aestuarii]|uniref:LD-carboxypeptidase n=1 Tax=Oxynema aestuarii AP17 TaxID=2064643 RepID=A0A6H1TW85_9CYAN|nr:LD-carboxypeptidase [Oxynema aestuarii]QIZ69589.1 LD-carboxypeptidase [Oxynema aestuarii AP17]
MNPNAFKRRQFLQWGAASWLLTQLGSQLSAFAGDRPSATPYQKPPRLKVGDTVGLINPSSPIEREDLDYSRQALAQLGLKVKFGAHALDRYGYLAGRDRDRAADVNAMFADPEVKAILTVRGGWGGNRILPLLDYDLVRSHPKIFMGYSDTTSLLLALYSQAGLPTFHGPVGTSTWNEFSVGYVRQLLFEARPTMFRNPPGFSIQTIAPGKARGRLVGGNLSVLAAMVGSIYLPSWDNTILFVEEIGEDIYRVDRMLTQLKLAGILDRISGFIFGQCSNCTAGEGDDPSLTLPQVLSDLIRPLGVPAWYGSAIGHIPEKFTLPLGIEVEIDARQGTIALLESAVL